MMHLSKMLLVIFIPILGGLAFTIHSFVDNLDGKGATADAQTTMTLSINIGRLIYTIQKERDMSILYISKIGPGTKAFLIDEYTNTDMAFSEMWDWRQEFSDHPKEYFRAKTNLINHIYRRRNALDPKLPDVYGEIAFYSEIVEFFMNWMIGRIRESGFGNTWKVLIVFQKMTRCMLDTGAERAYGAMFYAQGNFPDETLYDNYFKRIFRFNYNYRSASYYSDLVDPLLDMRTDQQIYSSTISALRGEIKNSNFSGSYKSTAKAEDYFDNASFRVDYLFNLQESVAARVINRVNFKMNLYVENIVIYSVTASIVLLSCPLIVIFTEALTSNMQSYALLLDRASSKLRAEQNRVNILLYQMIPKAVAERLKGQSKVESEFFKTATVMFTGIINFSNLSNRFSPMEMIDLLNALYTSIDEKIEKYDVYKVETINDTYMVVSGVPLPNGSRHAIEIAYLALDIVTALKDKPLLAAHSENSISLSVGVCTGSVSAGVIGSVMLRYCLFGDTVNIASRMKSYCKLNRIHISDSTFRTLKPTGCFRMIHRGSIFIKGKGDMDTYWLAESLRGYYQETLVISNWGHTLANETESYSSNTPEPVQSYGKCEVSATMASAAIY